MCAALRKPGGQIAPERAIWLKDRSQGIGFYTLALAAAARSSYFKCVILMLISLFFTFIRLLTWTPFPTFSPCLLNKYNFFMPVYLRSSNCADQSKHHFCLFEQMAPCHTINGATFGTFCMSTRKCQGRNPKGYVLLLGLFPIPIKRGTNLCISFRKKLTVFLNQKTHPSHLRQNWEAYIFTFCYYFFWLSQIETVLSSKQKKSVALNEYVGPGKKNLS